jgi:hypothetical protein
MRTTSPQRREANRFVFNEATASINLLQRGNVQMERPLPEQGCAKVIPLAEERILNVMLASKKQEALLVAIILLKVSNDNENSLV